jgi:ferrochelatase
MARAATPGTDPRFISMITELVKERGWAQSGGGREARGREQQSAGAGEAQRRGQLAQAPVLGSLPIGPDFCQDDCCRLPAARRPVGTGADQ